MDSRLVQKSGYIRRKDAGGYMRYIATREGVEKVDREGYLSYIATRPRVERRGSHGLFGSAETVDLGNALAELEAHDGNVWTIIWSLRREDAARFGYDRAAKWRSLLIKHQEHLAQAMKINMEQLHWYGAFHDEGHHPHIHVVLWSDDPNQGFLTKKGIADIRSKLTNDIFRDELTSLYKEKDLSYRNLTSAARKEMRNLIRRMESEDYSDPVIEQKMAELVLALETTTGKKKYGYLKKPVKRLVDEIVDELEKHPAVAECYGVWNRLRDELESYYHSEPRTHLPLSQQKEFRVIKNIVIQEAEAIRLGTVKEDYERYTEATEGERETAQESEEQREKTSSVLSSASRLLHHMSRIFREQAMPPANPEGVRIDSKRRKRLQEKRMAMGHKANDHEDQTMNHHAL